jgi:hypothetical protein
MANYGDATNLGVFYWGQEDSQYEVYIGKQQTTSTPEQHLICFQSCLNIIITKNSLDRITSNDSYDVQR